MRHSIPEIERRSCASSDGAYGRDRGAGRPTRAGRPAHLRRPRVDPWLAGPGQWRDSGRSPSPSRPRTYSASIWDRTRSTARPRPQATGLSYENAGSPATSNFATVDISQTDNIATLQASLPGTTVTLGPISRCSRWAGQRHGRTPVSSSWTAWIRRTRGATATWI